MVNKILENRKLRVKIHSTYSEEFTPEQGLPQGSPLSPLLYNIYSSDIYSDDPKFFCNEKYVLQYADDTALLAHGKSLNDAISKLELLKNNTINWFNKWRLKPNPEKSHMILYYHKPSRQSPSISIYNYVLRPQTNLKYLGLHIDNKLNFNLHASNIKKKVISRAKHFSGLSWKNNGVNLETKSKIYKMICRPMIEYGHITFLNLKKPALNKLKVAETSGLRIISKLRHPNSPLHNPPNQLLYQITRVQPIEQRLTHLSLKFCQKK